MDDRHTQKHFPYRCGTVQTLFTMADSFNSFSDSSSMSLKTFPNGTPLPKENTNDISISSFNLLAPLYIRPIDTRTGKVQPFASFDWIPEKDSCEILGDAIRLPKLLKRLQSCGSDFICVQELQLESGDNGHSYNNGLADRNQVRNRCSRIEDSDPVYQDTINNRTYVLPEWISPLVTNNTSETTDSNDNCVYCVTLADQTELQKMGDRNKRVLQTNAAVTNAIFYRSDKWRPISSDCLTGSTTNCVMQAFLPVESDEQIINMAKQPEPIVIVSIHLDARSEEKRVQQLQRCLELSKKCSENYTPSIIIAGDYNCELFRGSCVNRFLDCRYDVGESTNDPHDDKPTIQEMQNECAKALRLPSKSFPDENQMKSWIDLCDKVSSFVKDNCLVLNRIDTGTTRVAYNHDDEMADETIDDKAGTKEGVAERKMEQWHLDHIIYTPLTLNAVSKWSTLEDDAHSATVGLPNVNVPTDHLPIAASFHVQPHPRVNDTARSRLISKVTDLEQRQRNHLNILQTDLDRIRAELEIKYTTNDNENGDVSHKTKKSKKKSAPEIIEHIRHSRAVKKDLKAKHQSERQVFIENLSVLERMEMQNFLKGMSCRSWAENQRS